MDTFSQILMREMMNVDFLTVVAQSFKPSSEQDLKDILEDIVVCTMQDSSINKSLERIENSEGRADEYTMIARAWLGRLKQHFIENPAYEEEEFEQENGDLSSPSDVPSEDQLEDEDGETSSISDSEGEYEPEEEEEQPNWRGTGAEAIWLAVANRALESKNSTTPGAA